MGAVAYFLLTGHEITEGLTLEETLLKTMSAAPTPPSTRVNGGIPKELDELILACLARDPSQRPQTAIDVIATLDALATTCPWSEEDSAAWWIHRADASDGAIHDT